MSIARGQLVRSRRGHDAGELFCVMGTENGRLLLCDGKRRKTASPKRKNPAHVESAGAFEHPVLERLRAGESVGDRELRALLAAVRDEMEV